MIHEFVNVRARRRGRAEAAGRVWITPVCSPLLVVEADDLRRGLELFQHVEALGAFDAVLAAAAHSYPPTAPSPSCQTSRT